MKLDLDYMPLVRINAPELYADPAFIDWLNDEQLIKATWHTPSSLPDEYSDLWFTYAGDEGSEPEMPRHCWEQLMATIEPLGEKYQNCLVWLTNLDEGDSHETNTGQLKDPEPDVQGG